MDNMKKSLIANEWIFNILAPPVKEKLQQNLNLNYSISRNISTTFLTSKYYLPSSLDTNISEIKPNPFQLLDKNICTEDSIEKIISHFFKEAKFNDSTTSTNLANLWILELKEILNNFPKNFILLNFIEYVILIDNVKFKGASHPHFLSSIFISIEFNNSKFDFFISLIHESAHQELFILNFIDRLIEKKFDNNLIHAPYQNQLRPPIGRLHSLHALFRMIQFTLDYDDSNQKLAFFIQKFKQNLSSFQSDELTDFGNFLLQDIYVPFSKNI